MTQLTTQVTQLYRKQTIALRADFLRHVIPLWKAVDLQDVDSSFDLLAGALTPLILDSHSKAVSLAANYIQMHRMAAGISKPFDIVAAARPNAGLLSTVIRVTGPVAMKTAMRNYATLDRASDSAMVQLMGGTGRLVMSGGQDTIMETARTEMRKPDSVVRGWARVTSGNACGFCTMLADRGGVYTEDTSSFESHDHCSCSAELVYNGG